MLNQFTRDLIGAARCGDRRAAARAAAARPPRASSRRWAERGPQPRASSSGPRVRTVSTAGHSTIVPPRRSSCHTSSTMPTNPSFASGRSTTELRAIDANAARVGVQLVSHHARGRVATPAATAPAARRHALHRPVRVIGRGHDQIDIGRQQPRAWARAAADRTCSRRRATRRFPPASQPAPSQWPPPILGSSHAAPIARSLCRRSSQQIC